MRRWTRRRATSCSYATAAEQPKRGGSRMPVSPCSRASDDRAGAGVRLNRPRPRSDALRWPSERDRVHDDLAAGLAVPVAFPIRRRSKTSPLPRTAGDHRRCAGLRHPTNCRSGSRGGVRLGCRDCCSPRFATPRMLTARQISSTDNEGHLRARTLPPGQCAGPGFAGAWTPLPAADGHRLAVRGGGRLRTGAEPTLRVRGTPRVAADVRARRVRPCRRGP